MNRLSHARIVLEAVEDDATPNQIAKVLWDIINYLEQPDIGFKNEKEK